MERASLGGRLSAGRNGITVRVFSKLLLLFNQLCVEFVLGNQRLRITVRLEKLNMALVKVAVNTFEFFGLFIEELLQEDRIDNRHTEFLDFQQDGNRKRLLVTSLDVLLVADLVRSKAGSADVLLLTQQFTCL